MMMMMMMRKKSRAKEWTDNDQLKNNRVGYFCDYIIYIYIYIYIKELTTCFYPYDFFPSFEYFVKNNW